MRAWLQGAWQALRKLPIAKWIRPIWKAILRSEVERESEALKVQLLAAVAREGPGAVDRVFDTSQARLRAAVLRQRWLPGDLEDRLAGVIEGRGNDAQQAAKEALAAGGLPALDRSLTVARELLLAKIEAL